MSESEILNHHFMLNDGQMKFVHHLKSNDGKQNVEPHVSHLRFICLKAVFKM